MASLTRECSQPQDADAWTELQNLITSTYSTLAQQIDLSPHNNAVNSALSLLVSTLSKLSCKLSGTADIPEIYDYYLKHLPVICGLAECEMEKWWARRWLLNKADLKYALQEFWYARQYRALVLAEHAMLPKFSFKDIYFLGSGALPLTAILLQQFTGKTIPIVCVDSDEEACQLSADLLNLWGLGDDISVQQKRAEDVLHSPESLIVCASLLDSNNIYHSLYQQAVEYVLVRDCEFPYSFLYRPAVQPNSTHYQQIDSTHIDATRINTSCLFKLCQDSAD